MLLSVLLSLSIAAQRPQTGLIDIQRVVAMAEDRLRTAADWQTTDGTYVELETYRVSVYYRAPAEICKVLDSAVQADCATLKLGLPTRKIPVYLFPDRASLNRAVGFAGPTATGLSLYGWSAMPAPDAAHAQLFPAAAVRELSHPLLHRECGNFSCLLLSEGLADYLEATANHAPWLSKPAPVEPFSLRYLSGSAQSPADFEQGARFCAYLFALDHGNPARIERVMRLVDHQRQLTLQSSQGPRWEERVAASFKTVYGLLIDELEANWRQAYPTEKKVAANQ